MTLKFKVELIFETNNFLTETQVEELLLEQWDQTSASGEGDSIMELKVTKSA